MYDGTNWSLVLPTHPQAGGLVPVPPLQVYHQEEMLRMVGAQVCTGVCKLSPDLPSHV